MTAALETCAYVRTATKRTPGMQSVADKLQDRFRRTRRKADEADTTPKA